MLNKILLSLIISTSLMFSQTTVEGDVSGTWTLEDSPYIVVSTINLVGSLTIDSGVEVNFNPSNDIRLYSNGFPIYAMGTEDGRITISGNLWKGIYLQNIDTPSIFNYCDIYNATNNVETNNTAIEINNCNIYGASSNGLKIQGNESVAITNTNIYENGQHGLYCTTNNPFLDNVVSFNNGDVGFVFHPETDGYEIILSNIESYGNDDGINLYRYGNSTVHHVISRHNREDGIEIWDQNGNEPMQLNNNIFDGNAAHGIKINNSNSQSEKLIYNNIMNNNGCHGITNESDMPGASMVTSNLLFENGCGGNCSGDLGSGSCDFNSGYTNHNELNSDIFYNISTDPMIVEGDQNNPDYHLNEGSPCIDAGATIDGLDPDGTYSDIGLYYYDQTEPDLTPTIDINISSATANPGDTVHIAIEAVIPDSVQIFSASIEIQDETSANGNLNIISSSYNTPSNWIAEADWENGILNMWWAGSAGMSNQTWLMLWVNVVVGTAAIDDEAIPFSITSISFDEVDYNININEGTITIETIPPLVPNYGDVSLNGSISPFDASMILQYEAEIIGLDEQQMLNADVSGDTSVSAMDASLILQYGVGLIEEFPVESGAAVVSATGNYYMDNYSYNDGTNFEIPVYLDNGNDIYSFKHQFTYDSDIILIEEITKGDNIEDFIVQFNPDNSELIVVGASSDEDGITGTFFTISGSIVDENIYGIATNISLDEVRLNENDPDLYESNYTTLILNSTLGDLNSDLSLNVLDIVITANIVVNQIEPTEYQIWASDINWDEEINVLDIVALAQIVLDNSLSRGEPLSKATIEYGDNKLGLSSNGSVSGIQLEVSGDFIITGHNLPHGWKFYHSDYTILAFNMGGENISSGTLLEYEGDLSIESTIIADSYGNGVMAELKVIADEYSLLNIYPNPFNPVTSVNFTLPIESEISLEVYNLQGRMVEVLASGYMQPGQHSITWNADSHSSGVYFVKMNVGEFTNTQKLMLIK